MPADSSVWCVIPAAGRSTRMGKLTAETPKPLLPLAPDGGPSATLLGRILSDVGRVVTDACIVVPGREDRIRRALGDRWAGVDLHYVVQEDPRGVGHAVCRARGTVDGPFVVIMGDAYYHDPVAPCIRTWRQSDAPGAVLVEDISPATGDPMGLVRVTSGRVREIRKSGDPSGWTHRVSGLFMLPAEAFGICPELEASATGEVEVEALVRALMDRGVAFTAVPYRGYRRNVNSPADLEEVRRKAAAAGATDAAEPADAN